MEEKTAKLETEKSHLKHLGTSGGRWDFWRKKNVKGEWEVEGREGLDWTSLHCVGKHLREVNMKI